MNICNHGHRKKAASVFNEAAFLFKRVRKKICQTIINPNCQAICLPFPFVFHPIKQTNEIYRTTNSRLDKRKS